jgi:hypothetical protein
MCIVKIDDNIQLDSLSNLGSDTELVQISSKGRRKAFNDDVIDDDTQSK